MSPQPSYSFQPHLAFKASTFEVPFILAQASNLARPTKFVRPGLLPETSPNVACLYKA
jgi:hypothetical protein